ncbi:MAG: 1-acyl-sn-glycerol-3-phosphate acyltransferase [Spirochaetia bacterium]
MLIRQAAAVVGFLILVVYFDLKLRWLCLISPKSKKKQHAEEIMPEAAVTVFNLLERLTRFKIDFETDVAMEDLPEQFVIAANHQSILDILVLVYIFRNRSLKFITKWSLRRYMVFISNVLRKGKHGVIRRKGMLRETHRALSRLAERTSEEDFSLIIFPEGIRSKTGKLKRFHTAGMKTIMDRSELPVVSIAMDGGWELHNFASVIWRIPNKHYKVKLLKVYDHVEKRSEVDEMVQDIRQSILDQLTQWREQ